MTLAVNIAQSGSNNQTMRNRIINGAMMIDQRNNGASVASPTDTYIVDRWTVREVGGGVASAQQSSTAPVGFTKSLLLTVTTPDSSIASTDRYLISQFIEGYNIADLNWGTANAQPITLSFWVRSSVTGTYGGALQNTSVDRAYPFTYTISSANTYEYKTVTIPGDTSGTWNTTNDIGIAVRFGLGIGSTYSGTAGAWSSGNYLTATGATNWIATSGATFYITGVQLEEGTAASPFENRLYGTELQLCQRYYYRVSGGGNLRHGIAGNGSLAAGFPTILFKTTMRATPTFTFSTLSDFLVEGLAGGSTATPNSITLNTAGVDSATLYTQSGGSGTGTAVQLLGTGSTAWTAYSAEL